MVHNHYVGELVLIYQKVFIIVSNSWIGRLSRLQYRELLEDLKSSWSSYNWKKNDREEEGSLILKASLQQGM